MRTKVVRKGQGGPDAIYIGRGGPWGNPFPITPTQDRDTVISMYRDWLWGEIKAGQVSLSALAHLHGKTLECFCAPLPCHGDVLAAAAKWAYEELLGQ